MSFENKPLKRSGGLIVPQFWNETINDWEVLKGSDGAYRMQAPIDVAEEPFSASGNLTKEFTEEMSGLAISNDGDADLTFTIHGKSRTLKAGEVYEGKFKPFTTLTVNSTVPWRAEALQAFGGFNVPIPDTTAPNNVTNLLASNITTTGLTLNWTASNSNDTVGYDIYRGSTLLTSVTGTTYNTTGLSASTQYTFNVKAKDAANNIATGTAITVTTEAAPVPDTTPPINVTNLVASNIALTSLTLGWSVSSSTDVASYEVYQGSTLLSTVTGTTYNVTGLANSTQYTFTVKAKDGSDNVASGASVTATTSTPVDSTPPANVTNLTTANVTATSLTLNWTASLSSDVASYDIYNGSTLLSNVTATTYNVTGLTAGTSYTFNVKAKDENDNVASGTSVSISTVPNNVTNLIATSVAATSLTLSWTGSTGATSYDVFNGSTLLSNVTSPTYNVSGLIESTQYTFKVVAKNTGGSASGTNVIVTTSATTDTTAPDPITSLVAGSPTIDSIPITWVLSASNDVANYEVAYSTDGTNYTVSSNSVNSSSTSYTVTGLSAVTNYTIRVVSIDTSSNRSTAVTTTTTTATVVNYTLSATPSAGSYNAAQSVSLSTNPTGATIYYTVDGSTPTTSSSVYSTAITVNTTKTIKFFAKDSVGNQTTVQSAHYTIDTTAPTVSISPVAGTYGTTQSVTLSADDVSSTTIYYTIDGTTPTEASTVYSSALSVSATTTVKYFAKDAVGNASTVQAAVYTISVADATPPEPVTGLTAGTPTSSTIPVSWTLSSSGDVVNYEAAYSTDGTNYTVASAAISASATSYTVTGLTESTLYTIRIVAIDGANNRSTAVTVQATTTSASTVIVNDDYNRADSTTSLGTATSGQSWTALTGTWGIIGNQAYTPSGTIDGLAVVESGQSNCTIEATIATKGTNPRIAFRVVDAANHFVVQAASSNYQLFQKVSGTWTQLTTGGNAPVNGDIVKIVLNGNNITVLVNGTQIIAPTTNTNHATATKHGIGGGNNAFRFDNFKITT